MDPNNNQPNSTPPDPMAGAPGGMPNGADLATGGTVNDMTNGMPTDAGVPVVPNPTSSDPTMSNPAMNVPIEPPVVTGANVSNPAAGGAPTSNISTGTASVVGMPDTTGLIIPTPTAPAVDGLPMTAPLMRPDLPPAPDPAKQELEAPMKPAEPVAGSIGSAMSVRDDGVAVDASGQPIENASKFAPKAGGRVPNVAFNDPAAQPSTEDEKDQQKSGQKTKKAGKFSLKNMNRELLVILIVIASMIVIGLCVALIAMLVGK